jgi:hypothetical protein
MMFACAEYLKCVLGKSLTAGNKPLLVVVGVQIRPQEIQSSAGGSPQEGGIPTIQFSW